MKLLLERGGVSRTVELEPSRTGYRVHMDGITREVEGTVGGSMRLRVDGRPVEGSVRRDGEDVVVEIAGIAYAFRPRDARAPLVTRRLKGAGRARGEVHAPMPGLVVEILASVGDRVEAGRPVVVVEAMKMQNALAAPVTGRVGSISVSAGATVETGQLILAVTPEGEAA